MQSMIQTLAKNRLQEDRFARLERLVAELAEDIQAAKRRFAGYERVERDEMFTQFPAEENPKPLLMAKTSAAGKATRSSGLSMTSATS